MATFEQAYYEDEKEYISVEDYDKRHYTRIYCPECHRAPIHIVRKEKIPPYYASNKKEEHLENCQHYEDHIPNKTLNSLIKSKNSEDKERLGFLIQNGLQGALNVLMKHETNGNGIVANFVEKTSKTAVRNSSNKYKKESIRRVSIKRLFSMKETYLNNYIIIWGNADIESKEDKKFKRLYFRIGKDLKFSISLSENQRRYYTDLEDNAMNKNFAVFGQLKENKSFLNLKIETTKHLQYL